MVGAGTLHRYTAKEVAQLMRELGFPDDAAALFMTEAVNGGDVLQLTNDDLIGDLNLSKLQVIPCAPCALLSITAFLSVHPERRGGSSTLSQLTYCRTQLYSLPALLQFMDGADMASRPRCAT